MTKANSNGTNIMQRTHKINITPSITSKVEGTLDFWVCGCNIFKGFSLSIVYILYMYYVYYHNTHNTYYAQLGAEKKY